VSKVGALIGFLCCYLLPVVFLLVSRVLERRRCLNRLIFMIAFGDETWVLLESQENGENK
jgi:hypothetical protein